MRSIPLVLQVALLMLTGAAGFLDHRTRRIPNLLVVFGLILGLGLNTLLDGTAGLWVSLRGCGLALLIYFPLFALRAMGAGDAKLMAAVGSIVGPGNWIAIFFLTAALGGLVGLALTISRQRAGRTGQNIVYILNELVHFRAPYRSREELSAGHPRSLSMAHGVVIFAAAAILVAVMHLNPR